MITVLWVALVLVGCVAALSFGLVLVLARRLRALTEHVYRFLPIAEHGLPEPGTPLPGFHGRTADGREVSERDFAGAERVLAFLTTDCTTCHDQVPALRDLSDSDRPAPVAVVIGPPAERAAMAANLTPGVVVLEEDERGPLAEAFGMHEFPAVLVVRDGHVQAAAHGVAGALATVLARPA